MNIEVIQINEVDISVVVSAGADINIDVSTLGIQGPAGASASISQIITYSLIFG